MNIDSGSLRTGCWGENLILREKIFQEVGENYTVRILKIFMNPEVSLSHLLKPIIGPHPETDEYSPHRQNSFPVKSILIILSSTLIHITSDLFPSRVLHLSSRACYKFCLSFPRFEHPNNVWWRVHIFQLLDILISASSSYFLSVFSSDILLSTFFSDTFNLCSSLGRDTMFHTNIKNK
jgi:hypothetical protein